MSAWMHDALDLFWKNAFAAIPLVIAVAAVCRWASCRPTTRHALWAMILAWMAVPPMVPGIPWPEPDIPMEPEGYALNTAAPFLIEEVAESTPLSDALQSKSTAPATNDAPLVILPPATFGIIPTAEPVQSKKESLENPKRDVERTCAKPTVLSPGRSLVAKESDSSTALSKHKSAPRERAAPERRTSPLVGSVSADEVEVSPSPPAQPATRNNSPNSRIQEGKVDVPRPSISPSVPAKIPNADKIVAPLGVGSIGSAVVPLGPSWSETIRALRNDISNLPRIPSALWIGGMLAVGAAWLIRMIRFQRLVRTARPASLAVSRLVAETAEGLGLRRIPTTWMVRGGVSPMIAVGRVTKLLLPEDLWSQLDGTGRRAILCHELAHIRRRDHWVCRGELIVAVLYWWHPLVWWIRHRLHEEAELCCDAWVTWLMPHHRRAYAEALLRTKHYLMEQKVVTPASGIGVVSGRAARLARRIKMIMTGTFRPRLSLAGFVMAAGLAAAGWLVTPVQSCPPEEKEKAERVSAGSTDVYASGGQSKCNEAKNMKCEKDGKHVHVASDSKPAVANCSKSGKAHVEAGGADSLLALHPDAAAVLVMGSGEGSAGNEPPRERGRDLEERLERLEQRLDEMMERMGRGDSAPTPQPRAQMDARPRMAPPVPPIPGAPTAPPSPGFTPTTPTPGIPRSNEPSGMFSPMRVQGPSVTCPYNLPEGKREALIKLMSRDDIPVLIRPQQCGIEVIAPVTDQHVFQGFLELIDSSKKEVKARTYVLPQGKLEALWELMARQDVPIVVQSTGNKNEIRVNATSAEHAAFEAFVRMIDPRGERGAASPAPSGEKRLLEQTKMETERSRQMYEEAMREAELRMRQDGRRDSKAREAERRDRRRADAEAEDEDADEDEDEDAEVDAEDDKEASAEPDDDDGEEESKVAAEYREALRRHELGQATNGWTPSAPTANEQNELATAPHEQGRQLQVQAAMMAAAATTMMEQRHSLEEQADSLRQRGDELSERAAELIDAAEKLEEQANADDESAPPGHQVKFRQDSTRLVAQMREEAAKLEAQSEELGNQADAVWEQASAVQDQIAQLEEQSESISEIASLIENHFHPEIEHPHEIHETP